MQTMSSFIIQSRSVKRKGCRKLELTPTERDCENEDGTVRMLSPRLEYPQEISDSLGMKYSSLVSRAPFNEKSTRGTGKDNYDIFEQEFDFQSLNELPHPTQLLKRKRCSEEKKKPEKVNIVDEHISQLRRKRAKLEESKRSSADRMFSQISSDWLHGTDAQYPAIRHTTPRKEIVQEDQTKGCFTSQYPSTLSQKTCIKLNRPPLPQSTFSWPNRQNQAIENKMKKLYSKYSTYTEE